MKTLLGGLQAHLDSGETTMVHCWKVTRNDGTVQGFTEHDRDLTFGSVTYSAATGFTASAIETTLGLSVDNLNAEGAISSETLTEQDLAAGRYDGAEVELFWVNFNDVSQRVLLSKGNIGQVSRGELLFSAELRSQSARLQQRTGRVYQRTCDAVLGDARCKVALAGFTSTGTVSSVAEGRRMMVTGLSNDTSGYYSLGVLTFTSGDNNGLKFDVKSHSPGLIDLWSVPPFSVTVGTTFSVVAGCDKKRDTCINKFNNVINFQGFPYIPGNDFITRYAIRDSSQQGESIYK